MSLRCPLCAFASAHVVSCHYPCLTRHLPSSFPSLPWSSLSSPQATRATDCGRHLCHDEEVQIKAHDSDPGAPL